MWINEWGTEKTWQELKEEKEKFHKEWQEKKKNIKGKMIYDPFVGWIPMETK